MSPDTCEWLTDSTQPEIVNLKKKNTSVNFTFYLYEFLQLDTCLLRGRKQNSQIPTNAYNGHKAGSHSWESGTQSCLPCGCQGSNYLSHHYCPHSLRSTLAERQNLELGPGVKSIHSDRTCRHLNCSFEDPPQHCKHLKMFNTQSNVPGTPSLSHSLKPIPILQTKPEFRTRQTNYLKRARSNPYLP